MSNDTAVKTFVSLQGNINVDGHEFNVVIQAGSATEARDELAGLLGNGQEGDDSQKQAKTGKSSGKGSAKKSTPKPDPKQEKSEPTETAQQTDSEEATAPEKDAGSSATETATVSSEDVLAKAKELLGQAGGQDKLAAIVKKHGAQRVTTIAEDKRAAAYADIVAALGGDEDEGGLL